MWPDLTEGQHDRGRAALQHQLQQPRLLGHAPGDEAHAHPGTAGRVHFAGQPVRVAIAAAEEAEAPRPADGSGEAAIGHEVHGSEQNWVPYAEQFRQARRDRHGGSLDAG